MQARRLPVAALAGAWLAAAAPAFALCEAPWRVNVGEWRPYTFPLPNGDAGGIDVAVVKSVAANLRCTLRFTGVPPERAHALLASGDIDILLAASDLPERRAYAWFSAAYRHEVTAVLAPAQDSATPASFPALLAGSWRLLAPRFGWYGKDYESVRPVLQKAGRMQWYDEYDQGASMLKARRADLLLGDERALNLAASARGQTLRRLFVSNSSPVHMMLGKRTFTAADVARFNVALASTSARAGNR